MNLRWYDWLTDSVTVVSNETEHRFNSWCAFIYSDNLVIINQVTPVTIQNKKSFRNNTNNNIQIT